VNFAGRPVVILGEDTLFAVINHQGKPQVLVGNNASGEGAMFIDQALQDGQLRVVQQVESQNPVDFCQVYSGNLKYAHAHNGLRGLFIAKVLANKTDNLRVCYSGHHDLVPSVVATTDSASYNLLDAGNVFFPGQYGQEHVESLLDLSTVQMTLPATWDAMVLAAAKRAEELWAIREEYIARFLRQEVSTLFISLFTVEGNVMSYGGIRIVVNNGLDRVLTEISRRVSCFGGRPTSEPHRAAAFEFEQLLPVVVESSGSVEVDGVPLRYEKKGDAALQYLNGRKISSPDLDEVINRVTCYRNRPELYDQFLRQVSAVSLKFHRAVARGIPIGKAAVRRLIKAVEKADGGLPNDFSEVNSAESVSAVEVSLPFRKANAAARGEVFILDEWRKVENFDLLLRMCAGECPRLRSQRMHYLGSGGTGEVLRLLGYIDRSLESSCQVLPELRDYIYGYGGPTVIEAASRAEKFLRQFKIDVSKRQEAIARSRELFLRIVTQEKVVCAGPPPTEQWIVTGRSGRSYRINREGAVTGSGGEHLCIVNGGGRDLGGWDYLSSLIVALANDTLVAGGIGTLKL
jgi:hypothetical protein